MPWEWASTPEVRAVEATASGDVWISVRGQGLARLSEGLSGELVQLVELPVARQHFPDARPLIGGNGHRVHRCLGWGGVGWPMAKRLQHRVFSRWPVARRLPPAFFADFPPFGAF